MRMRMINYYSIYIYSLSIFYGDNFLEERQRICFMIFMTNNMRYRRQHKGRFLNRTITGFVCFIFLTNVIIGILGHPVQSVLDNTQTIDVSSIADSQVCKAYPSSNYGTKAYMYVQSASSGYKDERAWMKFNISSAIPPGSSILSASVRMYCWKADGPSMHADIHPSLTDNWGEYTITWANQPSYQTAQDTVYLVQGNTHVWYEWDVTSFVQAQWSIGDSVLSFVVRAQTENTPTTKTFAFDSKEWSSGSYAPRIRIRYTSGPQEPGHNFTIFHFNDVHSRLLPHDLDIPGRDDMPILETVGGAAYFTTKMLELKNVQPESLVLCAGDIFEGGILGDLRYGNGTMRWLNLLDAQLERLGGRGIDAICVGNHDVRTLQYINELKYNASFPVLSINLCYQGTTIPYFSPFTIVTVNDTRIGILGFTHDGYQEFSPEVDAIMDLKPCVWDDSSSSTIDVKDYVQELREMHGCDIVVFLAHIGHNRIVSGTDQLIVDVGCAPPEIIVAGHWHTFTDTAWQPKTLNGKSVIVEAAAYLQCIGELQMTGGTYCNAMKHFIKNDEITANEETKNLLAELWDEYNATAPRYNLEDVIGYTLQDLRGDKDKWWTLNEYPWSGDNIAGEWICDGMQWKVEQLGYNCDLAMQSGGGIRRDVKAGPITYREIYETYPWNDDELVLIRMSGQQIWNYIKQDYVGTSFSKDWVVFADDGDITQITYQGAPIGLSTVYDVAISEYMYHHEFQGYSGTCIGTRIRDSVVEYTALCPEENPLHVQGPRYVMNTEFSGGFTAVVTAMNDVNSQPYFDCGFIRLLTATEDTIENRGTYVPVDLVNPDGSINKYHQFSESMLYRSHLGFPEDSLHVGDIICVYVEGGFYAGNPQLVDQEGILADGVIYNIIGHDESLARPDVKPDIASFWDEWHENHYVKFYAKKIGGTQIRDYRGMTTTSYKIDGYYTKTLPGVIGDILEITGMNTQRDGSRRLRIATVTVAPAGYPGFSKIDEYVMMEPDNILLQATAMDPDGMIVNVEFFYRYSSNGVTWGSWTRCGSVSSAPWDYTFTFVDGDGYYEFYTVATDNSGNREDAPLYADINILFIQNQPPVAVDDVDSVDENSADNKIDVLANDIDDGSLSIIDVSDPLHGIAVTDGYYVYYTPDPNYHGTDEFFYTLCDDHGATDSAMVMITVMPQRLPDIVIDSTSFKYFIAPSSVISPRLAPYILVTATITNKGNAPVTQPFFVIFCKAGTNTAWEPMNASFIGKTRIRALDVGDSTDAVIQWRLQPDVQAISIIADSGQVISESNENNNQAIVDLPHFMLWKSLMTKSEVYTKLGQQHHTSSAQKVVHTATIALRKCVYIEPVAYLKFMVSIADHELQVGKELDGQIPPVLLERYTARVQKMREMIDHLLNLFSPQEICWKDAHIVGELQLEICDIVKIIKLPLGDVNGDGSVTFDDIDPFIYALTHTEEQFQDRYPSGSYWAADCNLDGVVDRFDVDPFVALVGGK